MWRRVVLGAILAVSFSYAHAVEVTARIKGTVTDPSGAVVAKATVTVTNSQTGVVTATTTSTSGDYIFPALPIGNYSITVAAPGFKGFTATGITLNIDQEFVEPVQLTLGSSADTVSVEADSVQVNTTDMQLSNIVDSHQITELPLIGRAFTNLEQILPGVQASSDRFGSFSVNGSQTQQSAYVINGADSNDLPLNTIAIQPNIDALAQFNLITGPLNAEYDRNGGAVVNTAIKQGTNHFHGDVFEFYRDTFLNTRNYFQKSIITLPSGLVGPQPTATYHQNIFGGTIGGPIVKDKLFGFFAYQGIRQVVPEAGGNVQVFTAAQLAGNYANALVPLAANGGAPAISTNVIPGTVNIPGCSAGVDTFQTCFTRLNGQLPASAFNPVAANLIKKYVPAANSGVNTYTFNPTVKTTTNQYIGRVDYNLTQRDQFYGVYINQNNVSPETLPFTGGTIPGFGDVSTTTINQVSVGYTRQISNTMVNDLEAHWTRFNFQAVEPQTPIAPSSLGFAISPQNTAGQGAPFISYTGNGIGGYSQPTFAMGFSTNGPQPRIDQVYQINDSISKSLGHHNLKFGYDLRRYNVSNPFSANNNGNFGFDANSGDGNNFTSGDVALDYLLGIPISYAQGSGAPIQAYAFLNYMFAQDTWKATSSLTLSYGLGYQIDTPLHNLQFGGIGVTCFLPGVQSKVFPSAPKNLNYPGDPGCNNASGATTRYSDFGPRLGFAWAPDLGTLSGGASRKLSIRGGFGIYYNRTEEETSLNNLEDPPFGVTSGGANDYATQANGITNPSFVNPYQDLNTPGTAGSYKNKFPFVPPSAGSSPDFSNFLPFELSQYAPGFRSPYSENFQLTVEREFPGQFVARASYVGTLGRHNQSVVEGNPITPAGQALCLASTSCNTTNRNNQNKLYPTHTQFGYADTANGGINDFASIGLISTIGSSNYNALQLSVDKGLTHGLQLQASYTYSHALDNASNYENSGYGGARGYNQYQPGLNYGNSAYDTRQRFVFAPVYVVPFKKGGSAFAPVNLLASGWEISAIATFATGFPYDISYGGGTSRSLFCSASNSYYACPDVPEQIAPLKRLNPRTFNTAGTPAKSTNTTGWFSSSSFGAEPLGQFGNIGRYAFHGPGINNTNLILAKNFALSSDGVRTLQLRMESDNVFNHTQFSLPTSNFTSTNFGNITAAAAGRQTQLAAKIYF
jgi:Carboxypeptidase regulatory-like domain